MGDIDIDDGGPAFPRPETEEHYGEAGMSLRDWFAGQAINGIQSGSLVLMEDGGHITHETQAKAAYDLADAMIAARKARRAGG